MSISRREHLADSRGQRIKKTSGGTVTRYYYNGSALTGLVKGNDTVQFVYDAFGKPFLLRLNGTYDYYYLYNGQDDVTGLIDSNNAVVVQFEKRMAFFKLHLRRKNAAQIVPMPAAS